MELHKKIDYVRSEEEPLDMQTISGIAPVETAAVIDVAPTLAQLRMKAVTRTSRHLVKETQYLLK